MDFIGFIRHLEDFLKNRVQKEFLEYKLFSLRKEALVRKKEPGKGLSYSHGILLVLEALNEIEINLREKVSDNEKFILSLEKLNKARKFIEKGSEQLPKQRKSLLEDKVIRPNTATQKVLLPDILSSSEKDVTSDDTMERLQNEIKEMKLASDNKLARLKNQLNSLLKPDTQAAETSYAEPDRFLFSSSEIISKNQGNKSEKRSDSILEHGLSKYSTAELPDKYSPVSDPLCIHLTEENKFNMDSLIPERKEKFASYSDDNKVDKMRDMMQIVNKSMIMIHSSEKKTKELSEFDLPDRQFKNERTKKGIHRNTGELSEDKSLLQKDLFFSKEFTTAKSELPDVKRQSFSGNTPILMTGETDFKTSHNFKSRLPYDRAYHSHYEKQEVGKKYSEDIPLASPLYTLLTGYNDLKAYKIDFKLWLKKQDEAHDELNYLLNRLNLLDDERLIEQLNELVNLAITLVQELKLTCRDIEKDKNRKRIYEPLDGICRQGEEDPEVKELAWELQDINLEIYNITKDIELYEESKSLSVTSIEEIFKNIPETACRTPVYVKLEQICLGFLRKEVRKEDFIKILEETGQLITDSMEKYQLLQVTSNEITIEVHRGNQLINEAFSLWHKGISSIKKFLSSQNEDDIHSGLKFVYEGTKKLVFLHYFSEHIEKQLQVQNFQVGFSGTRKKA
ncbi:MAG: hypothetical protein ABRQ38_02395 [Candidatus Eremiobacterota bacterium]